MGFLNRLFAKKEKSEELDAIKQDAAVAKRNEAEAQRNSAEEKSKQKELVARQKKEGKAKRVEEAKRRKEEKKRQKLEKKKGKLLEGDKETSDPKWMKKREMAPQTRYMSQSIVLEESFSPNIARLTMFAISFAAVAFFVWAWVTSVKEVTKTNGEVVTSGNARKVQNLENGLVSEILVEEGDKVKTGQVVIRLNSIGAQEDLRELNKRQVFLLLEAERLRAFVGDKEPQFELIEGATELMIEDQKNVLESMNASRQSDQKILNDQIAQKRDDLTILEGKEQTAVANLALAEKTYSIKKKTYDQGLLSEIELIEAEKEKVQTNGALDSVRAEINQAKQAIAEYENRLYSLGAKLNDSALQQLGVIQDEINRNDEAKVKLENRVARLEIKAPIDGLVKGLAINTVGEVINPGQVLMEIVPTYEELVLEVRISPYDIGHVHVRQDVTVRVDTYDATRYGTVDGKLSAISATTFLDDQGNSFYKGRVVLNQNYVGDHENLTIQPGMTVEADIITGEKTVIQYLFKPVQAVLTGAFKER